MTTAKDLFKRHNGDFGERMGKLQVSHNTALLSAAILYAACIIAETIENRLQSEKNKF